MKPISAYTDVKQLQQIMKNAKALKNDAVYNEAFQRRCQLEGIDYDDPLDRDFYATLAAYEELLSEKNGKKTPAGYTRRSIKTNGIEIPGNEVSEPIQPRCGGRRSEATIQI